MHQNIEIDTRPGGFVVADKTHEAALIASMDKRPRDGAAGGENEVGKRARSNLSTGEDDINAACAAGILC